MNVKEFAVLEVINIAGAYARPSYWCTAAEIVRILEEERHHPRGDRLKDERKLLEGITAREVGYILRRLHSSNTYPRHSGPLVEKRRVRGINQWRASEAGLAVEIA